MSAEPPTWDSLVDWVEQGKPAGPIADYLARNEQAANDTHWIERTVALLRQPPFPAPPPEVRARVLEAYDRRYAAAGPWVRRHPLLALLLATAAITLFVLLLDLQGARSTPAIAAQDVRGDVIVTAADGTPHTVLSGQPLRPGDLVTTGAAGYVTIQFDQGAATFRLWPESELLLDEVQLTGQPPRRLAISCKEGRMQGHVSQGTELVMNAWGNEVRGTASRFEVNYNEDLSTQLRVEEGQLAVSNLAGQATFDAGDEVLLWYETFPGAPLPYPLELPEGVGD